MEACSECAGLRSRLNYISRSDVGIDASLILLDPVVCGFEYSFLVRQAPGKIRGAWEVSHTENLEQTCRPALNLAVIVVDAWDTLPRKACQGYTLLQRR